ncbi:MAG: metallophosphoesterase family protein [Proteobacteria bacterium]|nr:metallophosphoesterase family protein [Pseudomonadota bacterium]
MAAKLVERSATIELPGGVGVIAVVSDTHSAPHARIAEHLTALAPAAILHGGDIGDLDVLAELATFAPLHAVRGNIDTRAHALPDVMTIEVTGRARILLTHIAIYGAYLRAEVVKRAKAAKASLVVCGHSHVPFIGSHHGLAMFNPGSIGPRRFSLPISFGTITFSATAIKLAHIDCETGLPWSPP